MNPVTRPSAHAAIRCLAAVSLLALSGCVSASSEEKALPQASTAAPGPTAATAEAVATTADPRSTGANTVGGYVDPAMVAASSARVAPHAGAAPGRQQAMPMAYGQAANVSGLATQPTGISAGSLSIYANSQPNVVAATPGAVPADVSATAGIPAYAPPPKISPALNSVYSAPVSGKPIPVVPPVTPTSQQHSMYAAPGMSPDAAQDVAAQAQRLPAGQGAVPVAAFAADAAQKRGSGASAGLTQMASLPMGAGRQSAQFASNGRAVMSDEFDDTHGGAGDKPAGLMKLASLSGLSRMAPNGLLLQTEQVSVGCFKPEMIRRIKEVEAHYGRRAMVTSGYRPPKATTQGSKHYTCDAADIQVSGVSKWELATYLRSLPDRGGVGTYCHTESVHMDIGEPRDWNWRCRRTSSSL